MKKCLSSLIAVMLFFQLANAQKASDVLEDGIPVKANHSLIFQFDGSVLRYDSKESFEDKTKPVKIINSIKDSAIFLVHDNSIGIYMRPLNPLSFSVTSETKTIDDPIDAAAAKAMGSIIDILSSTTAAKSAPAGGAPGVLPVPPVVKYDTCLGFIAIENNLKAIQELLKSDKKTEIAGVFTQLKDMTFSDEASSIASLNAAKTAKTPIDKHFTKLDSLVKKTNELIENYNCNKPNGLLTKYVFSLVSKDLSSTLIEQKKRLANLDAAYKTVSDYLDNAKIGGGDGLRWCVVLDTLDCEKGKISVFFITIQESGYKLSDDKEIVSIAAKDKYKKVIRVRKFQRFVPEVSVGVAYSFFKYNTYGTTTDSLGIMRVAEPTENMVRNINISTMLNFNYYIPNSPIHPLIQLGAGINSGIPTILAGGGLRFNINGLKRLAIAGGVAMTWIKELDKLSIGSEIKGTDDIDKDLKFQFIKPRGYIGLQYNF